MTKRLVLFLPFGVILILRDRFTSEEEAGSAARTLPRGFEIVDETEAPENALEVPLPIRREQE